MLGSSAASEHGLAGSVLGCRDDPILPCHPASAQGSPGGPGLQLPKPHR